MKNTKMTKVEKFAKVAEILETAQAPQEMVDFINNESDMVARKNAKKSTGERKPSKTQLENKEKAEQLTVFFDTQAESGHAYTNQEIGDLIDIPHISSQKATAIMKLVENVEKTRVDGKVAYSSLIVEIDEDGNEV